MRSLLLGLGSAVALLLTAPGARAGAIFGFSDASGLAAEAEFTLLGPTTLEIRLRNTSTGVPPGFSSSDQILTGVSWDFGQPGPGSGVSILAGSVVIGSASASLDFDQVVSQLGPGDDVSGEWGYGNNDGTGALNNFISALTAVATPFGGVNRDGPASIDGPQGGLVANPLIVPLDGLGAVQDEVVATLTLSGTTTEADLLADLDANGVRFEFGSDASFFTVPEPGTALLFGVGLLALAARRRPTGAVSRGR